MGGGTLDPPVRTSLRAPFRPVEPTAVRPHVQNVFRPRPRRPAANARRILMAKALYGHLAADPALLSEVAHLRRRVRDLEDEIGRLRAENDALAPLVTDQELVELRSLERTEPVLT